MFVEYHIFEVKLSQDPNWFQSGGHVLMHKFQVEFVNPAKFLAQSREKLSWIHLLQNHLRQFKISHFLKSSEESFSEKIFHPFASKKKTFIFALLE